MGKKGKKSKRQKGIKLDANEVALIKILNNMQKMQALVYDKIEKKQYSEAASRERDAITYLATQENAMTNASVALAKSRRDEQGGNHFATALVESYRVLMFIEFDFRKNYGNVIEVYNDLASKYSHLVTLDTQILEENVPSSISIDMKSLQLFYELALIRTDKSLSKIPIIKSFILREMKDEATMKDETTGKKIMILKAHTIDALRVVKEYKTAIDLDGELVLGNIANLLESKPFETTASLLVSFVERYRIEKYQSLPSAKARNYSVMYGLLHNIPEEFDDDDCLRHDYLLASAQLSYLCHKKDNNEQFTRNYLEGAIQRIECIASAKWKYRNHCSTCHQKSNTPSKLQLICRDCRVSCYCGIDHQRASWMKNEVQGTRLGHKVFCPVLKAYRVWMEAKEHGDEEREAKMERRFKKECIAFLAYGLGLKDKCFGN